MVLDIPDVIAFANFGEDRLRGLGVAGVRICPSSLTLIITLQHSRMVQVCDVYGLHMPHMFIRFEASLQPNIGNT